MKEATSEEEGLKEGTCQVCNAKIAATIGKVTQKIEASVAEGNLEASVEAVGDTKLYEDIVLKTEDVTEVLHPDEKKDIQEKAEKVNLGERKTELAIILDISLFMKSVVVDGSSTVRESEYEPEGRIRITIDVPLNILKNFENIKLLHFLDDGTVDIVDYLLQGSKATFETDSLSYFAFAGTPIVEEEKSETNPSTPEKGETNPSTPEKGEDKEVAPVTGDVTGVVVWMLVACVAVMVFAGTIIVRKRK